MKEKNNYYNFERSEVAAYVPHNILSILDVGCGRGAFLKLIKEQTGAETWGIEPEKEIAEEAKNITDHLFAGKVEDMLASIPDDYFDCITLNDVLEHLYDPVDVLKMIKSKLTQQGIIIASIPNVRFFDNLYELIYKGDWKYSDAGILDFAHLRFFTKTSMLRLFDETGYTVTKQVGINKKISWKSRLFVVFTCGVFTDTLYRQFICMAKKK